MVIKTHSYLPKVLENIFLIFFQVVIKTHSYLPKVLENIFLISDGGGGGYWTVHDSSTTVTSSVSHVIQVVIIVSFLIPNPQHTVDDMYRCMNVYYHQESVYHMVGKCLFLGHINIPDSP